MRFLSRWEPKEEIREKRQKDLGRPDRRWRKEGKRANPKLLVEGKGATFDYLLILVIKWGGHC